MSGVTSRAFGAATELAYPSRECRSVPHVTPGPFLKPDSPLRSDIREGLGGVPLKLKLRIVDDIWCQPVDEAVVDMWQCDAIGRYSGVENINFDINTLRVTGVHLTSTIQRRPRPAAETAASDQSQQACGERPSP